MITVLFLSFIIFLFMGVPVAFSLGLSSLIYLVGSGIPLMVIPQRMFAGINSFTLLCIPGFILAGNLMNRGGISDRIIAFANILVGPIRGGLAQANVVASMVFAGVSGTAVADTASLGSLLIPAMHKEGYDLEFSCAVTASSSCIGPIIPPSMPMIIAGTLTGLSVGKLFLAGAVPGILMGLLMMIVTAVLSARRGYPKGERPSWRKFWHEFYGGIWALMMMVLIFAGILSGWFSPTEAAIVACIYAMFVGLFVYKDLKLRDLPQVLKESAIMSAAIITLVGLANVFAWILASERIPQTIARAMMSLTSNKYVIILLVNIFLLFVGMFMETIAALMTLFPTLLAVLTQVSVDPIQCAMICVLNLIIGLITPPVGICLFVASSIGKIPVNRIVSANLPYLLVCLLVLALVSFIPAVSTWLPSMLM
ncbi:TRAP transporter large permease [Fretibacterium sp. OH1220_COT-178]|uniref:TRAP transporter large permease n=1 Tax=Fretibacterium sp. OH1220_COT-178 TaxID=2491047 RepID=UPI000F5DA5B5|nr:TRAP transporter large permease [Fretibacterium sp. OH1220_COT-178]RRD66169.1 TRAP transporter large permease [Fretibacterium sp. OH1220_COT-178]